MCRWARPPRPAPARPRRAPAPGAPRLAPAPPPWKAPTPPKKPPSRTHAPTHPPNAKRTKQHFKQTVLFATDRDGDLFKCRRQGERVRFGCIDVLIPKVGLFSYLSNVSIVRSSSEFLNVFLKLLLACLGGLWAVLCTASPHKQPASLPARRPQPPRMPLPHKSLRERGDPGGLKATPYPPPKIMTTLPPQPRSSPPRKEHRIPPPRRPFDSPAPPATRPPTGCP